VGKHCAVCPFSPVFPENDIRRQAAPKSSTNSTRYAKYRKKTLCTPEKEYVEQRPDTVRHGIPTRVPTRAFQAYHFSNRVVVLGLTKCTACACTLQGIVQRSCARKILPNSVRVESTCFHRNRTQSTHQCGSKAQPQSVPWTPRSTSGVARVWPGPGGLCCGPAPPYSRSLDRQSAAPQSQTRWTCASPSKYQRQRGKKGSPLYNSLARRSLARMLSATHIYISKRWWMTVSCARGA